jgi:hypothetical protein
MSELVQWQKIDPSNGLVYPWWTHPFLEELSTWDLSKKVVLETGSGRSTAWLRDKCAWVDSIETSPTWLGAVANECAEHGLKNGRIVYGDCPDGLEEKGWKAYESLIPRDRWYDIVIIDANYRTEMLGWCLDYMNSKDQDCDVVSQLTVIADNWQQSYVWMSPKAEEIMKGYKGVVHEQTDHVDNDGINKWKTAYWVL